MTAPLVELLARARQQGLTIGRGADGTLRIRGPKASEPLARALLARKAEVLTAEPVYNGTALRLDWRREPILTSPQPCVLCRRPTLLIEPWDKRPAHKTCCEAAIRWGTAQDSRREGAA